ncbi:MAG: hypothetical protein JXN61_18690 [Sedimentisphaerales bacterium]|nr:hypothetical protein [Sedimentisphaerales bacterium]
MKEIDFLPEWYKSHKRRSASYRMQCVVLGGIFVIMMVWNYFEAGSISRAEAEIARLAGGNAETQGATVRYSQLKAQIADLQKQAATMKNIDSRIDVAGVLAELSFLITRPTVLSRVELTAERFADGPSDGGPKYGGGLVKAVRIKSGEAGALPLGDVRFKVVIGGVAPESSDVAALICRLEDSPYFFNVVPSYSRNTVIRPVRSSVRRSSAVETSGGKAATDIRASEFEVSCYLANYRQE